MSREVVFLHESVTASVIKDVVSVGTLTGGVAMGVYLQSPVLQFFAGLFWVLVVISRGVREMKNHTYSLDELRARLEDIAGAEK